MQPIVRKLSWDICDCVRTNNIKQLRELLKNADEELKKSALPLLNAALCGCSANVKLLLQAGFDPNMPATKYTWHALCGVDLCSRLWNGMSIDGQTPLFVEAARGHAEIVRILLNGGLVLICHGQQLEKQI